MSDRMGVAWVLAWVLASAVSACGGSSRSFDLVLELAPAAPAEGDGCAAPTDSFGAAETCLRVRVCKRSVPEVDCDPATEGVMLERPASEHSGSGRSALDFALGGTASIGFDARWSDGLHDVVVDVFGPKSDGMLAVLATGRARGVVSSTSPLRVRLYRRAAWSCAGGATDPTRPVRPRALHAIVPLPNGDALVFGGVKGEGIDPFSSAAQGALERAVELYSSAEERFVTVPLSPADSAGLGRVWFTPILLSGPAEGPYRVRIIGGVGADGDDPVLRFDGSLSTSPRGLPVLPAATARFFVPEETVDLVYDPGRRTAALETSVVSVSPPSALNAVASTSRKDAPTFLAMGFGPPGPTSSLALAQRFAWLNPDGSALGSPLAMVSARIGAAAADLGSTSPDVLVWGGNLAETDPAMVLMRAGERARLPANGPEPSQPISADAMSGLPPPVAFAAATLITPGAALISGGLRIGTQAGQGVVPAAPAEPLVVFSRDPGSGVLRSIAVQRPAGVVSRIFHSSTSIGNAVAVAGGAVITQLAWNNASVMTTLHPNATSGVVRQVPDGTFRYESWPSMQTARWGHAAAMLPGDRLIVTGGFRWVARAGTDVAGLRATPLAEIFEYGTSAAPTDACSMP